MPNVFDINQMVASAYVTSEQIKGMFLATAKMLLVLLSGILMFLGVASLAITSFTWQSILLGLPFCVAGFLLAICVEGGTVFCSAKIAISRTKIIQELAVIDRVAGKLTSEEVKTRKDKIKKQLRVPIVMLVVCCIFSVAGAEIFWHRLLQDSSLFFQTIGYLLGIVCSALLIMLEMNKEQVERVIESCIANSGLTKLALEESSRSIVYNKFFKARRAFLQTAEVDKVLLQASQQSLYAILADTIGKNGMSVSGQQLEAMVQKEVEVRQAAEKFIQSGGTDENAISPQNTEPIRLLPKGGKRMTGNKRKVKDAIDKYGRSRLANEPDKYADMVGVAPTTFKRILEEM